MLLGLSREIKKGINSWQRRKGVEKPETKKHSLDLTLCHLRWDYPIVNVGNMSTRTCCRTPEQKITSDQLKQMGKEALFNSPYLIERRYEMVKGVRHSDCQTCWDLEGSGMPSPRRGGRVFEKYAKKVNAKSKVNLSHLSTWTWRGSRFLRANKPDMLEIILSNMCDLKCVYCSHHYSTKWAAELLKFGEISKEEYDKVFPVLTDDFQKAFWKWFEEDAKHSLRSISFLGGEPLITPEFYAYLDRILDNYKSSKKTPTLAIITNLNTPPELLDQFIQRLPDLTKKFKVDLNLSMESMGCRAEYIRFGLSWDRWLHNLHKIMSLNLGPNLVMSAQMALNTLSITSLTDYLKFIKSLYDQYGVAFTLRQNIVALPGWHNPSILTGDFRVHVREAIDYLCEVEPLVDYERDSYGPWFKYVDFLKNVEKGIDTHPSRGHERAVFYQKQSTLDSRRGTQLLDVFPEYSEFWHHCREMYDEGVRRGKI